MNQNCTIDSKDISVIVQGAVDSENTPICLNSIRKYLPGAEIILSTWEGTDVSGLNYDAVVFNKDPGGVIYMGKRYNNLNRMILSSQNGIKKASRKYVLRLRSDLVLQNSNILSFHNDLPKRDPKYSLFKEIIYAFDRFSIKYDFNVQKTLFHISDWCHFGLKEDIKELFNLPLVAEPDFSHYFLTHQKKYNDIHKEKSWKMSPEMYISSSNAKKISKGFEFENYLDINTVNTNVSECFIINNFRVLSQQEWGIINLKKEKDGSAQKSWFNKALPFAKYGKSEILKDYKKYVDSEFNFKGVDRPLRNFILSTEHLEEELKQYLDQKSGFHMSPCQSSEKEIKLKFNLYDEYIKLYFNKNSLLKKLQIKFLEINIVKLKILCRKFRRKK